MKRGSEALGLFLDLDGTLANSLPIFRGVYAEFLTDRECHPTEAEFDQLNGLQMRLVIEHLQGAHGLTGSHDELLADFHHRVHAGYLEAPAFADAAELLDRARSAGWRIAVVTSCPEVLARAWLGQHGLAELVDTVVGGDAIAHGKPAPDPYLLAIERLAADPIRSLAVEDAPIGARSAVAAGLPTLALQRTPQTGADWPPVVGVVATLAEVDLERAYA